MFLMKNNISYKNLSKIIKEEEKGYVNHSFSNDDETSAYESSSVVSGKQVKGDYLPRDIGFPFWNTGPFFLGILVIFLVGLVYFLITF